MDNFIYIGYRMDCDVKDSAEDLDRFWGLKKAGFSIDSLPGEDWMFWTHIKCHIMNPEHIISVFPMQGEYKGEYLCPVDTFRLYQMLFENSIDVPDTFMMDVGKIVNTSLYRQLIEMFLKVSITWGVFLGLG